MPKNPQGCLHRSFRAQTSQVRGAAAPGAGLASTSTFYYLRREVLPDVANKIRPGADRANRMAVFRVFPRLDSKLVLTVVAFPLPDPRHRSASPG